MRSTRASTHLCVHRYSFLLRASRMTFLAVCKGGSKDMPMPGSRRFRYMQGDRRRRHKSCSFAVGEDQPRPEVTAVPPLQRHVKVVRIMTAAMSRALTFLGTQRAIAAREFELESGGKVSLPPILPSHCAEKDDAPPGNQVWRVFRGHHETMLGVVPEDFLTIGTRLAAGLQSGGGANQERPELGLFAGTELKRCPLAKELGADTLIVLEGTQEFKIADKLRPSVCVGVPGHPDYPTGYTGTGRSGELEEAGRRTTMSALLDLTLSSGKKTHPLKPSDALYIGSNMAVRSSRPDYAWVRDPVTLPLAVVCKPPRTSWVIRESRSGEIGLRPTTDVELRRACYSMCRSALARAHDVLVVGRAFAASEGRGVPPLAMARAMRQVVATYFPGCFRLIVCGTPPTEPALEMLSKAGWANGAGAAAALGADPTVVPSGGSSTTTSTMHDSDYLGPGISGGGGSDSLGTRLDKARRSASTASERSAGAASVASGASSVTGRSDSILDAGGRSPAGRHAPASVLAALAGGAYSAIGSGVESALGSHSPAAPSWVPQSVEHARLVENDPYLAFRHVWLGEAAFVPSEGKRGLMPFLAAVGDAVAAVGGGGTKGGEGGGGSYRGRSGVGGIAVGRGVGVGGAVKGGGDGGGGGGGFRGGYTPPALSLSVGGAGQIALPSAGSHASLTELVSTPRGSESAGVAAVTPSGSRVEEVDLLGMGEDDDGEPVL